MSFGTFHCHKNLITTQSRQISCPLASTYISTYLSHFQNWKVDLLYPLDVGRYPGGPVDAIDNAVLLKKLCTPPYHGGN